MKIVKLTREFLDRIHRSRKLEYDRFLKYGRAGRTDKYPMYYVEGRGWLLDMPKIEHSWNMRCQGCNEIIEANKEVYAVDIRPIVVYCHIGCVEKFRQLKPNILKRDVDRYKDFDTNLIKWIYKGIKKDILRRIIMKVYGLSRQPADIRMVSFLDRYSNHYSIEVFKRKTGGEGHYIRLIRIKRKVESTIEDSTAPHHRRPRL